LSRSVVSYATLPQLIDRYGEPMLIELTDREDPPTEAIVAAVVDRALADTDAMIDGYLAGRYALPLAETPTLLTDLALQIALYKLHRNVASEKVQRDHDAAVRTLRDIASGAVRLSVAGLEPAGSDAGAVRTNEPDRRLTPGSMRGFI
jgi:phage gp36-like protein